MLPGSEKLTGHRRRQQRYWDRQSKNREVLEFGFGKNWCPDTHRLIHTGIFPDKKAGALNPDGRHPKQIGSCRQNHIDRLAAGLADRRQKVDGAPFGGEYLFGNFQRSLRVNF
jgi:hypothetical protein